MKRKDKGKLIVLALAALFFIFSAVPASAEIAAFKKPLIWSEDGSAGYGLPEISGGVYSPRDYISTGGWITGITVNWQASGKIYFEVSADNGLNYAPAANGVPLRSGFVGGDRLRWRAKPLSEGSRLYSVRIDYTDTSGVMGGFGEPGLSGFLYRKEISIKNPGDEDLYNFQLRLENGEKENGDVSIFSGKIETSPFPVRFTAADGRTLLPYYNEGQSPAPRLRSGQAGTVPALATFWVKVPHIPKAGTSIYVYYGNAEAESLSDPEAVFDFYEDFKGDYLDKDKWALHTGQNGSAALANGAIKLDAAELITKEFKFKEGIIEYSALPESGFESSLNIRNKSEESYDSPIWLAYTSIYKGAEHCIAVDGIVKANDSVAGLTVAGEEYSYRVTLDSGKISFERFGGEGEKSPAGTVPLQASASYDIDPMPKEGYLSLRSGGDGGGKNVVRFGAIRCRKAAAAMPTVYNIGKEERANLPVFVNTGLSASGELVLKEAYGTGYYISADIPVMGETARIIIPEWEAENLDKAAVSVSISADRGATYKKNCENAKYYYASKKEFNAGSSLKARLDFSRSGTVPMNQGQPPLVVAGLSKFSLDYRPGKITVLSPNGAEQFKVNSKKEITWTAMEYEPTYLWRIEFSSDAGKNYALLTDKAANTGKFLWTVPDKLTKKAKIKITDTLSYDTSDKVFSIVSEEPEAEAQLQEALPEETIEGKIEETIEGKIKEKDLHKIIEAKERPGTELYDLVIKLGDNVSANAEEDARASFKEGDVVIAQPVGHDWSQTERASFLIVQAYLTPEEALELTRSEKIYTGKVDEAGRPIQRTIRKRAARIELEKAGLLPGVAGREAKLRQIRHSLGNRVLSPEEAIGQAKASEERGPAAWQRLLDKLKEVLR